MDNWSNEELLDQIIIKANQISIISKSNDLMDMRNELLNRFNKIKYTDCTSLIFMGDPEKERAKAYPNIDEDIKNWAKVFNKTIIGGDIK